MYNREEVLKRLDELFRSAIRPSGHDTQNVLYRLDKGLPEFEAFLSEEIDKAYSAGITDGLKEIKRYIKFSPSQANNELNTYIDDQIQEFRNKKNTNLLS